MININTGFVYEICINWSYYCFISFHSTPSVSGSYADWLGLIMQTTRRGMEIVNPYKAQVKEKKEEQEEKNRSSQPQRKSAKTDSKSSEFVTLFF